MTPEGKVKAGVKRQLDKLGAFYFMPATGGYGVSGLSDIVGCHMGRFFAIECKTRGKHPTPLQLVFMKRVIDNGGIAFVINEDNLEEVSERLGHNGRPAL